MTARRAGALVVGVVLLLVATAGPAFAGGRGHTREVCHRGVCWIEVVDPGDGGGSGGGSGSGAGSGKCVWAKKVVPCSDPALGYFNSTDGCYYRKADPYPTTGPVAVEYRQGGGAIYWASCPFGGGLRSGGYVWLPNPPAGLAPTPGQLARRAFDSLTLTHPSTGRYPAGRLRDGTPYTVVRAYTWYWTDLADFQALTARAAAGPVWAQVTVRPAALSFSPGDGSAAVSCVGPGTVWDSSYGVWAASPSRCDYRYPHSTIHASGRVVTATYSIRWQVSWTGSGNTSGTLPDQTTSSRSTFAVAEVESVVTH